MRTADASQPPPGSDDPAKASAVDQPAADKRAAEDEQPLLKFNFRFQPWADVLNYFAEQSDLSLVLDAPPPGTFNYSDSREYTPTEALDLLNGVLLTKGYTIIRRERMLLLINLEEGLPADLIPSVSIEELEQRGKFEIVRVTFAIGERNPEEVQAEIKPLLGPHGKTDLLPKTKQLIVIETAGKLRIMSTLIESMPAPDKSAQPKPPSEPEKPTFEVYPAGSVEPQAALSVFKTLLPEARIVHDANGDQLIAIATPSQQETIKSVLTQMQANRPAEKRPRLEVHPIRGANSGQVLQILTTLFPTAQLTMDSTSRKLVAWAPPADQESIRETIEQLGHRATAASDKSLKVYSLTRTEPQTIQSLLADFLPDAQLTVDAAGRRLVALASEEDHRTIQSAIDQFEAGDERPVRQLVAYSIRLADPPSLLGVLQTLLPEVHFVLDPKTNRLAAWAHPEEHETIKSTIEQFETGDEESARQMVAYQIRSADPPSLLNVLQTLLPEVRFVLDPKTNRLAAWARLGDHETIRTTIEQMDTDVPDELRLKLMSHPLRDANPDTVTGVLTQLLPEVRLINDPTAKALVAWAREADHRIVEDTIERLQPATDPESEPYMKVYATGKANPQILAGMLQSVVPQARVVADTQAGNVAAWGTKADHEIIDSMFEQIRSLSQTELRGSVAVYPLRRVQGASVIGVLQTLVPQARLVVDSRSGNIVAWAKPDDQEAIRAAIQRIEAESKGPAEQILAVYPLEEAEPSTVLQVLQSVMPTARFFTDPKTGVLFAWAKPDDHEAIRGVIQRIEAESQGRGKQKLAVYPLEGAEPSTVLQVLQSVMPTARFFTDPRTDAVFAWAAQEQHEAIRSTIERLQRDVPEENKISIRVYRFDHADPNVAVATLSPLMPQARMAVDQRTRSLVVTARPGDHDQIEAAIEQMERGGDDAEAPSVKAYAVKVAEPSTVLTVLRELFASRPEVRISLDSTHRRLVAWASPEQHKTIQSVLDEIQGDTTAGEPLQLEVHALGNVEAATLERILRDVFAEAPEVRLIPDPSSANLVAMAQPEQHATIRATIEQLQGAAQKLEVIPLQFVDAFSAELAIEKLFDLESGRADANAPAVDSDQDNQQLLVRGTPEQITQIRELLIKMGETSLALDRTAGGRTFRVIPLRGTTARSVLAELQRVWPQLRKNPIRVVTPSAVIPSLRPGQRREALQVPLGEPAEPTKPPKTTPQEDHNGNGTPPDDAGATDSVSGGTFSKQRAPRETLLALAGMTRAQQEPQQAPTTQSQEGSPKEGEQPSPIIVAPGPDGLTIASEDVEALDQFEALIKALSGRRGGGRDYVVFNLKSASAVVVAETLEDLFGKSGTFRGSPTIVPDERLNALIVQANHNDLLTIESLLEILDTTDLPETLFANRPKLIAVRHAKAVDVADVIREVYRTQMQAGGSRRRIEMPRNVPRELASVIEQLRATAAGPELSLSVDEITNSLIVLAAPPLLAEVEELVQSLDQAATDSGRTVRVVPLKKASTEAVEKALQMLIQRRARRGRS